jgi:EAL domain-containing protein (putative c-di-GMP-specific phosphodiesterase class I)
MHDEGAQFDRVARLVEAGAEIAIDDFGTGYSSLSYLTRLPAKYLKLDRSFIINLNSSLQQRLVRSVISIAHDVGMHVVAEGVETREQLDLLLEYECDYAQGYLFAKPLSATNFSQHVKSFAGGLIQRRLARLA